jgi:hypothetical protein
MAHTKPTYIDEEIGVPQLDYIWDDTRTAEDFEHDGEWLLERLQGVYLTGQIALGIGIYEWIVWRFQPLSRDPEPVKLAEAAWCATVHPTYMYYTEFDRHRWMGPIRGPLWCAQTWLVPMALSDGNSIDECEVDFLYSLAMHVLPTTNAFESWLEGCLKRLISMYEAPEEDIFTGLFRDPIEARGPLVVPQLLDLNAHFDPNNAKGYMSQLLAEAFSANNPFLRSPKEMLDAGFIGTPYKIEDMNRD